MTRAAEIDAEWEQGEKERKAREARERATKRRCITGSFARSLAAARPVSSVTSTMIGRPATGEHMRSTLSPSGSATTTRGGKP